MDFDGASMNLHAVVQERYINYCLSNPILPKAPPHVFFQKTDIELIKDTLKCIVDKLREIDKFLKDQNIKDREQIVPIKESEETEIIEEASKIVLEEIVKTIL